MKKIRLSKGYTTIVDSEDYEFLMQWKWYPAIKPNCPRLNYVVSNANGTTLRMHRLVMNAPKGKTVDHINGDTLDNRKCNLRICNHSQNKRNQCKKKGFSSRYKGVSWSKSENRWRSKIKIYGKAIYLGVFKEEIEAAKAYNKAAVKYHRKFAKPNEI